MIPNIATLPTGLDSDEVLGCQPRKQRSRALIARLPCSSREEFPKDCSPLVWEHKGFGIFRDRHSRSKAAGRVDRDARVSDSCGGVPFDELDCCAICLHSTFQQTTK